MNKHRINNVIINDNIVTKKKNDRVIELYKYLSDRGFENYSKILNIKDETVDYEYIKEKDNYELIKGSELIKTLSLLHSKTIEYKDTSKNKYRQIYDKIIGNIKYLKDYYEKIIASIEEEVFMSPSHYLFARNYSVIDSNLKYAKSNIKTWFNMVNTKSKERVCVVHNNISSKHFIKGDKNYLLSFDNYLVDTPILDLYKFYKNEGFKLDFNKLLQIYEENNKLDKDEKLLLNVLISIPPVLINVSDEYLNCNNIKQFLNYNYSSMNFININK